MLKVADNVGGVKPSEQQLAVGSVEHELLRWQRCRRAGVEGCHQRLEIRHVPLQSAATASK